MSKRVAGNKGFKARNFRVRIGWKRKKHISDLKEYIKEVEVTDAIIAHKFLEAKALLKRVIPKKLSFRHQGR